MKIKFKTDFSRLPDIMSRSKRKRNESVNILDYVSDEEENQNKKLSEETNNRFNYLYDVIIRKTAKKINVTNKDKKSFVDYYYANPFMQRSFTIKERMKMRKYLKRFFLIKKVPFLLNFSKNYTTLNNITNELEYMTGLNINSYNEFMYYGKIFYIKNNNVKKETSIEKLPNIKKVEKVETKVNKKVTSEEVTDLNTTRNKLLYRIRKLEKNISELSDNNYLKTKYLNHELKMAKLAILEIENDILNEKQKNEVFDRNIINNYDIRYENSVKNIQAYIRKYNNRSVKCSIEDYFGLDQVNYFRSLGIDVDSMLEENIKKIKRLK